MYIPDFNVYKALQLFEGSTPIMADNGLQPGAPECRLYFVLSNAALSSFGARGLIWPGDCEMGRPFNYGLESYSTFLTVCRMISKLPILCVAKNEPRGQCINMSIPGLREILSLQKKRKK